MKSKVIGKGALARVRKFFPKVEKVNDASKALTIEVLSQDANPTKRQKHTECALAVACKRKLHADGIIIARTTAYVVKGDTATRYRVTESAAREIISFDRGASFEPGEYILGIPPHKLGERERNITPKKFNHTGTGPVYHTTTKVRTVLGSYNVS